MLICPSCGEENPPRFRLCGFCGTPLEAQAPVEVRKTVTILFSDVAGSTSLGERLDPESLRDVMGRYFDVMRSSIERHGGTVEKYIGDAVMAVFGLPQAHEDDALRAVRAAVDMRTGLDRLNADLERDYGVTMANRTGVNTGEVVTDEAAGNQRLATGDAVNVAARLEQAAPAMETLLGALTHALVSGEVETEPVEPLELKGKAERVPAFRLVALVSRERTSSSPLVGRDDDLELLRAQVGAAAAAGEGRLVTVIGEAGVGKSRLLREFTSGLDGSALVMHGRCLPYGEGITFWPLAEAVRSAAAIAEDDSLDRARAKVADLAGGDAEVSDRVASAIGLNPAVYAVEETFWGVRRLFEILAADRPLVVVFEDLHWAEPTLLELIEHVVERVQHPCILVCTARPDLLDRPDAPAEGDGRVQIVLGRLGSGDAMAMAERLLAGRPVDAASVERIVAASDGNPLFMEQMAAMLDDADPGAELDVPPTILALLAARLDRLAQPERAVLEPAAVAGLVFPSTAVVELIDESQRESVPDRLSAVERRRFIRSHPALMGDDNSYEFEHILVRDAVYRRLLKRTRSQLHERFAVWADRVNGDRAAEFAEITAYHLEQAHRYLAELGPLDDHGVGLGHRAAERLAGAGQRAFVRGDMHAASSLLRRAVDLMPALDPDRLGLLPDLGEALMDAGELGAAVAVLEEAMSSARGIGDHRLAAEATLVLLLVQMHGDEGEWGARALREARRAISVFELVGDNIGLAKAWRIVGSVHATALRYGEAATAVERAMECARLAGDSRQERRNAAAYAIAAVYGPTPAVEAIERCREIEQRSGGDRRTEGLVLCTRSQLEAMQGDFATARQLYARGRAALGEIGGGLLAASTALDSSGVEMLAGDPAAAERELRRDYEVLDRMGERYLLSTMAGLLSQALVAQGRYDEAAGMCERAEEMSGEDDIESQVLVRSVRAELHLHAGRTTEAAAAIASAAKLLRGADAPMVMADVLVVSARVEAAGGETPAAGTRLRQAAELYRAKGNIVAERRTVELAASLGLGSVTA
jgi:class 3 adenylate cyclase/tetratricopeptide (TPR) repeat protein